MSKSCQPQVPLSKPQKESHRCHLVSVQTVLLTIHICSNWLHSQCLQYQNNKLQSLRKKHTEICTSGKGAESWTFNLCYRSTGDTAARRVTRSEQRTAEAAGKDWPSYSTSRILGFLPYFFKWFPAVKNLYAWAEKVIFRLGLNMTYLNSNFSSSMLGMCRGAKVNETSSVPSGTNNLMQDRVSRDKLSNS